MRTKKPLDLHLAQPMWKLLAGMSLTAEDLEEVCVCVCVTSNAIPLLEADEPCLQSTV